MTNKPPDGAQNAETVRLQQVLLREAKKTRDLFREVVQRYSFRVEGQLDQVIKFLSQETIADSFFKKTPDQIRQDLRLMISEFKSLKVKPNKGRRKDLKRIENLIDSLLWVQELDKPVMVPRPKKSPEKEPA